jgi:glycosyltransferase 2 family protein
MGRMVRWAIVALKVALPFALVVLLIRFVGKEEIFQTLSGASRRACLWALLLMIPAVAMNALRWRVAMTALRQPLDTKTALLATFESVFFQQIFPSGVGGDISRSVRAYNGGASVGKSVIGAVIDRANGLLFVALTIVAARYMSDSPTLNSHVFAILFAASLVIVAGAGGAIILGLAPIDRVLPARVRSLKTLIDDYSRCMRSPLYLTQVLGLLVVSNFLYIESFRFCALAVGLELTWWDGAIVCQGMVLAAIIPFSLGGWGLREGAALLIFGPLGVDAGTAVAISILFGLVLTALGIGGAIIWFAQSYKILGAPSLRRSLFARATIAADEADV